MTEHFLQYVWFHGLYFPVKSTTEGDKIEVLHPGLYNRDEGPDAFNARIKIEDVVWVGNVEVHLKSSQWRQHKHDLNPQYNNVILHVVSEDDEDVVMKNGVKIPTLVIKPREDVLKIYDSMMMSESGLHCVGKIADIAALHKLLAIEKFSIERMKNKSEHIKSIVDRMRGDLEHAFFVLICRHFGFSLNADAMEALALSFDYSIVNKIRNKTFLLEALLLGQAGFLDVESHEAYVQLLQREYEHLRVKHKLSPLPKGRFKMMRLRPQNFPTIRIAQFADLLFNRAHLYSSIIQEKNIKSLRKILKCSASNYWDTHYTLTGQESTEVKKKISEVSIDILIINVVVPFLFYCSELWDDVKYSQRAMSFLENIKPEKNRIVNLFEDLGFANENAIHSQGIIQCYKLYCQKKECLRCPLCYQLLKASENNSIKLKV